MPSTHTEAVAKVLRGRLKTNRELEQTYRKRLKANMDETTRLKRALGELSPAPGKRGPGRPRKGATVRQP